MSSEIKYFTITKLQCQKVSGIFFKKIFSRLNLHKIPLLVFIFYMRPLKYRIDFELLTALTHASFQASSDTLPSVKGRMYIVFTDRISSSSLFPLLCILCRRIRTKLP